MFVCYDVEGTERGINLGSVVQYSVEHKEELLNGNFDYNSIDLYMSDNSIIKIPVDYKKEFYAAVNMFMGKFDATMTA